MITCSVNQIRKAQKGFTLIELLVVIGILAILLAITLVAINPAKQFSASNDTKRSSDINEILNAIDQYAVDNHGVLPCADLNGANSGCGTALSATATTIGDGAGQVNLCSLLTPKYLAQLPTDPSSTTNGTNVPTSCTGYNTGYQVSVSASNNRATVYAPNYTDSNGNVVGTSVTR